MGQRRRSSFNDANRDPVVHTRIYKINVAEAVYKAGDLPHHPCDFIAGRLHRDAPAGVGVVLPQRATHHQFDLVK